MKISTRKSKIRTLKSDDPMFKIHDGFYMAPRAGFEINEHCPREYRQIIAACIDRGWLQPVANILEQDYIVEILERT